MVDIFYTLSAFTHQLEEGFVMPPSLIQEKFCHIHRAEALVPTIVVSESTIHIHSGLHSHPTAESKILIPELSSLYIRCRNSSILLHPGLSVAVYMLEIFPTWFEAPQTGSL